MKKLDLHVHCFSESLLFPDFRYPPMMADGIREMYDKMDIEGGVWMTGGATSEHGSPERMSLAETLRFYDSHRDLFAAWFCSIDPRMGNNAPDTDFSTYLNAFKRLGAKGVSETSANIPLDDPRFLNFFEHCENCGMSVTLHFGVPGKGYGVVDELHLPRLKNVLRRCPKLTVIGHSPQWWNEIADNVTDDNREGYVQGPVAREGEAVRILREFPNMQADLSAMSAYTAITRDPAYGFRFLEEFADRLYFATDNVDPNRVNPALPTLSAYLDKAVADGNISRNAYQLICRGNAERLLGLS